MGMGLCTALVVATRWRGGWEGRKAEGRARAEGGEGWGGRKHPPGGGFGGWGGATVQYIRGFFSFRPPPCGFGLPPIGYLSPCQTWLTGIRRQSCEWFRRLGSVNAHKKP